MTLYFVLCTRCFDDSLLHTVHTLLCTHLSSEIKIGTAPELLESKKKKLSGSETLYNETKINIGIHFKKIPFFWKKWNISKKFQNVNLKNSWQFFTLNQMFSPSFTKMETFLPK